MKLTDCEIAFHHMRGHNVAFVFGARAITDSESGAIAAEWVDLYGPVPLPGYVSKDGWQVIKPAATEATAISHAQAAEPADEGKRGPGRPRKAGA